MDVIVAFPDVSPSFISLPRESYQHYGKPTSRRAVLREKTNTSDQPHLWYSTSEVIKALELFIASGDELSASNTYRLIIWFQNIMCFSNSLPIVMYCRTSSMYILYWP